MDQDNIRPISESSEFYPSLLREITKPPTQLYIRGNVDILMRPPLLAVVGSRKATHYGAQCAEKLLSPVIAAGTTIVSGLAYGIDALAHQASIKAQRPTIAVLGSGIDDASIYPRAHIKLVHQILASGGAIMSEYPVGTKAFLGYFPARNRIIAGLCQATLVIQAAAKSGSLITARLALESNRDVAAVPGPITDPLSAGTNQLIRDGAAPILEADDLLRLLSLDVPDKAAEQQLPLLTDPTQQQILAALTATPQHIEDLLKITKLSAETLSASMTELELLGYVQHTGGLKYVRNG